MPSWKKHSLGIVLYGNGSFVSTFVFKGVNLIVALSCPPTAISRYDLTGLQLQIIRRIDQSHANSIVFLEAPNGTHKEELSLVGLLLHQGQFRYRERGRTV